MTDTISKARRSATMRSVLGENTAPERAVRRILHGLGARFQLRTGRILPGSPDIVLPSRNTVIFVHGCFWHQHSCVRGARRPASNAEYWRVKLDGNVARDKRVMRDLRKLEWRVVVVWECEINNRSTLVRKLGSLLNLDSKRTCGTALDVEEEFVD